MKKENLTKESSEKYFQKNLEKEDSVFNCKLFINMDLDYEHINNSDSTESDNSDEMKDENTSAFLTKELIDELNSLNVDINLGNDYTINNRKSFIYYVNNKYDFSLSKEFLFNNFNRPLFSKFDSNSDKNNSNRKNYNKKKYKLIKDRKKDWVCQLCLNLNYAFRVECNRCHFPKEKCIL